MSAVVVIFGTILLGCAGFAGAVTLSLALMWWEKPARVEKRNNRSKVRSLRAANGPPRYNGWRW